jgi:hypothetical protein
MALRLSPPPLRDLEEIRTRAPIPQRRRARPADVLVTMMVCLVVWAVLFAPVLARNAETGPVGARRSATLAVLRPTLAISDAVGLSAVTEPLLRALGDDPNAQPGGELDLPDIDLPPLPSLVPGPRTAEPSNAPRAEHRGDDQDGGIALPPIRTPTPQNKLRIAVVGDSLAQGLGPSVERAFDPDVSRVLSLGRESTGLSREDYFNWPRAMREIEAEFRPDVVYVMLGTNDDQAQISRDGAAIDVGSTAWVDGYRARVAAFVHEATRAGTRVVWVGIPVVQEHRRWSFYRRVNSIYSQVAVGDPLATFVDTWARFEARDGGYTAFLRNERGVVQEMRAGDGVHFTPAGYDYLARIAVRATDEAFDLPQRAVSTRLADRR